MVVGNQVYLDIPVCRMGIKHSNRGEEEYMQGEDIC
jgi:hypothetical protein